MARPSYSIEHNSTPDIQLSSSGHTLQHLETTADNHNQRIGILIVAYNAVTTLTKVLKRIPADVWENVEEVVVFDDASKDATYEVGIGYKALSGIEKLHIIKNHQNRGYGGNQKLGYQYFLDKQFDVVVLLHGDGQYAPEILSHMYAPIVDGKADAVFGSRMMRDYGGALKGGMPAYKYVGNKILTLFENTMLGMDLTEFHSGYRAYKLDTLRQIDMSHMTNDFHFDTEIIIKLHHQGFRIKETPIPTYYGDEICYVNGMKYAQDVAKSVLRYQRTIRSLERAAEYAEYFVHYPLKESKYSSHYYFTQFVGYGNCVLDIGCGEGFFAAQIAQKGNRVVGIDLLPTAKYGDQMEQYISADLDQGLSDARPQLAEGSFDRILLQDVLEHLRRPDVLLQECRSLLKPHGLLLVSVPNVANIFVRLSLLLGRFEYTQRGILDSTHLRFFTRRSARKMLEQQGYVIISERSTVIPVELALGIAAANPVMRAINWLLALVTGMLPGLFGYQIIFVVR